MLPDGNGQPAAPKRAALTKTELIEEVFRAAEIPRKEAGVIVESILNSMVRAIDRGGQSRNPRLRARVATTGSKSNRRVGRLGHVNC